jgi:hypothetical protein
MRLRARYTVIVVPVDGVEARSQQRWLAGHLVHHPDELDGVERMCHHSRFERRANTLQLARNWSQLTAHHPEGFSSQRQALKALAAIVQADKPDANGASLAARGQSPDARGRSAGASSAARGQTPRGKRRRTGPVWRASGPFVAEALRLVRSIDESLNDLVGRGYPLANEAENAHSALVRLQQMIDTEIDKAEALQAAGE